MHFEIASAKRRRSRERWAFKDSRGTEFSFKRMRSTPRKARQLVAPRRSRERQSAKFHAECKSLVTVIPRDETLIGNYAEQFANPTIRIASIPGFERRPGSSWSPLRLFHAATVAIFHSRYLSPSWKAEEEKFLRRKIEIERDTDGYRSLSQKC